jgi:arylsulfatase A
MLVHLADWTWGRFRLAWRACVGWTSGWVLCAGVLVSKHLGARRTAAVLGAEPVAEAPPNLLIITVDNLGYGDLRSYNPDSTIQTPRLDQFAAEGARLTSFYTASPTCTVSRAGLLTGRIAQRHGLNHQLAGVAGNYGVGLNQDEILIPQILKTAPTPYVTGCFGKWNIGFAPGSRPTERGFDEFLGHVSGNLDYYEHNYRERHDLYQGTEELQRPGEYVTDIFADAAIDFIQRHSAAGQPWFCYLPFNAPHFPVAANKLRGQPNVWQAPDWAFEVYGLDPEEPDPLKRYGAVVTALDQAIGRVLDALDAAGEGTTRWSFSTRTTAPFDWAAKAWTSVPTLRFATAESPAGKAGCASSRWPVGPAGFLPGG